MVILDLDNCISDDAWRIPRIQWQHEDKMRRFHEYHSLSPWDECGNRGVLDGVAPQNVAIFTARPVHYRTITEEWLRRNSIGYHVLMMRNDDDHRPSSLLKQTQLGWLIEHFAVKKSDIFMAYDDRSDVVGMYRANGIPATQISIHNVGVWSPEEMKSAATT